ncbi:MAG: tRNA (adenosine(37)-N6)-dimethylallyltransferase MiaA [Oscillospiraceae bacterium]
MNSIEKLPVIVVAGPTASGKTALGIEIAKRVNGEIISADSMQIYKGMDIATAKPTDEEMQGIPHHLIGFVERTESFSVADYVALANEKIKDIHSRGKQPVIVGGTGLYIDSLVDNIQFAENADDENIRKRLEKEAELYGNDYLLEKLDKIDHETASTLHANNIRRVIRAIEVFEVTGKTMAELKRESRSVDSPYRWLIFGLTAENRQYLYDRINHRTDIMVENGLVKESENVYSVSGLKTAHQAIGFKELIPYFENQASLEECIDKIKLETRRYAKRQLTWFRKNDRIEWLAIDKFDTTDEIIENCMKCIANNNFL